MTRQPGVSIVIPSWNGLALLERFLPSVQGAARRYQEGGGAPVEIIVVDDASEDATAEHLLARGFSQSGAQPRDPPLRLLRNENNLGFGATCNRGFQAARHSLVFLLNNDVEVAADAIAPLVEHFSDAQIFAVHCRVFELDSGRECGRGQLGGFSRGFLRVHRGYSARETPDGRPGPLYSIFASGGSAMFDRRKFLAMGGFEPLLSPIYWEDVQISYRAWKRGYAVLYEPRSIVHHRVSSTMRKAGRNRIWRMQQRNRLIFHWMELHDSAFFAQHIGWVLLLAVTAPLRMQFGFLRACVAALRQISRVRRRRAEEKLLAKRSDRQVLAVFQELAGRPDIGT